MCRYTQEDTHLLTQSRAKSLHISSHSLHSAAKRLKCHKCSCSRRGQWKLSKPFAASEPPAGTLSLSLSARIPYSAHSFFITSSLLSSSLFFFFCSLSCSLICLFPLSGVCTMRINYSEAVSRSFPLIQSERGSALMGSCCTCYRLQHTRDSGGWERGREG